MKHVFQKTMRSVQTVLASCLSATCLYAAPPALAIQPKALGSLDLNSVAAVEHIVEPLNRELGAIPAENFRA